MRLAFLTDPHLPMPHVALKDLVGKPVTGWLNWQHRKDRHDIKNLKLVIEDIASHAPDRIVVGGDLVNLALESEAMNALSLLYELERIAPVTFLPGNHDAYTSYGETTMRRVLGSYWSEYPACVFDENTALIALSTAMPTPPLNATGRLGEAQLAKLATLLATHKGKKRVIALHHPPLAIQGGETKKRLIDAEQFREVILAHGAELILHGHTHRNTYNDYRGIPVIGCASASATQLAHAIASWVLVDGSVSRRVYSEAGFVTKLLI
jgi:3',5'-cyclic AMP phosphodiesterase CpdA